MKKLLLTLPILLVIGGLVIAANLPVGKVAQATVVTKPNLDELAMLVNKDRTDAGLQPLVRDPDLDASATDKCNDMVAKHYWEHVSPDGVSVSDVIRKHEQSFTRGENLSALGTTAAQVNTGWLGSPGHKANILRPTYTEVGYAICDVNVTYVTDNQPGLYKNVVVQHFVGK